MLLVKRETLFTNQLDAGFLGRRSGRGQKSVVKSAKLSRIVHPA